MQKTSLLILLALLSSSLATAEELDFDQQKVVHRFLDFVNGVTDPTCEEVEVTSYRRKNESLKELQKDKLSKETFERLKALSASVLSMKPHRNALDKQKAPGPVRFGSAFHIGNNLVLTNVHVLQEDYKNLTRCGDFQLQSQKPLQSARCKRVLYCQVNIDTCLIEMHPLKGIPPLKLKSTVKISSAEKTAKVVTTIGNTLGEGIKVSQGKGIEESGTTFRVSSPVAKGNSGGPLLDDSGGVIGLVKSMGHVDEQGLPVKFIDGKPATKPAGFVTIATRSEILIAEVRKGLAADPEALKKFNEAVSD